MPTLGDAAEALGLAFRGDPSLTLDRLAPISQAGVGDLSFIAQKKFAKSLVASEAAVQRQKPFMKHHVPPDVQPKKLYALA